MELVDLISVLWRRKVVVLASVALFLAAGVAATLLLPQSFSAETELLVQGEDSTTSLLNELGLSEMAISLNGDDIQNKIYLATSDPVVEDVIWKLQLRDGGGELYEPEDLVGAGVIAVMLGVPAIEVTQVSGTDVLVIAASGPSPQASVLMADAVAEAYIAHTTERSRTEIREAQRFIQQQLDLVNQELDAAFAQIAVAQQQDEIIDLESEVRAAVGRLSDLLLEREQTAAKIAELRAKIRETEAFRQREGVTGVSASTMTSNPVVGGLRSRLTELRSKREALLLDNHTPLAPEIKELDYQIAATEAELRDAIAEMAELDPVVASFQADLTGLESRAIEVNAAIGRTTANFATYPDKMRRLSQLELAANAAEGVYRSLQDQRFQIGIAEAMTMSDVHVVAPARLPESPSSPKGLVNVLAGLLLGLAFGAGSALLLEYVDDTLKSAESLRAVWEVPQLGLIPRYPIRERPALAVLPPTDPLAEAHRTVRNAIAFASVDQPARVLAITSSIPAEGKSTLAVNLAISMARDGRKVLLLDADLRLPTQHRNFRETVAAPGLVEVLTRSESIADVVQPTGVDNLWLLPAGDPPADPGQLVESLRMRHVLGELTRLYDVVIIDTPPLLAVADGLVVGRMVDGLVIVTELHRATKRMLAEVRDRLESAGITPLGIVLNKVRGSAYPYGAYAAYYKQRSARSADEGAA